jgi:uncharacterized membrane protein YeaQ/YmgE (transglycosylase-associated protein family)
MGAVGAVFGFLGSLSITGTGTNDLLLAIIVACIGAVVVPVVAKLGLRKQSETSENPD